jgi:hypothetical protein
MVIHHHIQVKRLASVVFKALKKTLNEEDFVKDFIKENLGNYKETDDPLLLEKKMTFLEALLAEPFLQVDKILTSITLSPKTNDETQFYNRAKLLRLLGDKFLPDPAKMLTLILRLILEGSALLEIEEQSKYLTNDTYVTMGTTKAVQDELTLAIKPLILKIPNEKIYEWQEFADQLYRECSKKGKVGVYITFIAEFIHHPKFQYDIYVELHLRYICAYIVTEDAELLEKVIKCINSGTNIPNEPSFDEKNLAVEWQNCFTRQSRMTIEEKMGINEMDETFDLETLPILESEKGVDALIKIYLETLLHGKVSVRADAAFLIGLVARSSPVECFKKDIIKMAGALIRILNDKFDDELKVSILRALRRMMLKAGKHMKPMAAPLKTTFSQFAKQRDELSDEVKTELDLLEEIVSSTLLKKRPTKNGH